LRQSTMCFLQSGIHIRRFSSDRQFIRETPGGWPLSLLFSWGMLSPFQPKF
jgi:hypothetical protein